MSLAIVHSRAQVGVEAPAVTVEARLSNNNFYCWKRPLRLADPSLKYRSFVSW
ncbi:hypothetical protein ALQ60_00032 [Pseudomonas syringae pv. papulans]|nr:hypothetical protein ALQ60_00032 [Pseudomonas syringae pv. papulans]RMV39366.1 hypothetical protein ALP11_01218 [Pseudomonas syringae pv. papulans]